MLSECLSLLLLIKSATLAWETDYSLYKRKSSGSRIRTDDRRIMIPLLYQLSYAAVKRVLYRKKTLFIFWVKTGPESILARYRLWPKK